MVLILLGERGIDTRYLNIGAIEAVRGLAVVALIIRLPRTSLCVLVDTQVSSRGQRPSASRRIGTSI
jgi:hypothetical protein